MRSMCSKVLWYVLFSTASIYSYQAHELYVHCARLKQILHCASLNEFTSMTDVQYIKCHDKASFCYQKLPVSPHPTDTQKFIYRPGYTNIFQPRQGIFAETFVAVIDRAMICGQDGVIKCHDILLKESFNQLIPLYLSLQAHANALHSDEGNKPPRIVHGRVAVLAHQLDRCYGHWFIETVGRIILLQMSGVEYDYVYAPLKYSYMRETYEIFGIPPEKIIDSSVETAWIQADQVIFPSLAMSRVACATDPQYSFMRLDVYSWAATVFQPEWMIKAVKEKFDPIIEQRAKNYSYAPKIFISRKDGCCRYMTNEDEIFALFEPLGFVRYELSRLQLIEQAILFRGATCIVAAHGSGLANILFCRPNTYIIEIFQNSFDASFYNWAQTMKCRYSCIKTGKYNSRISPQSSSCVDPAIIQKFITMDMMR